LCRYWGVSRQAYYKGRGKRDIKATQYSLLLDHVKGIRKSQTKMGTLKIRHELRQQIKACGRGFGRDKFFELLRKHDLLVKRRRKYVVTTNSNHPFYKYNNKLSTASVTAPDQAWVSDITYLRTRERFVYLSLVTDLYSRKIVGWNVDVSLGVEGSIRALNKAIKQCSDKIGLIHHSDRGIQYCCYAYTDILKKHGLNISMGDVGNCYDNAVAERVNGILKSEFLLDTEFANYNDAVKATKEAIHLYNFERPHWSLNLDKPAIVHSRKMKQDLKW